MPESTARPVAAATAASVVAAVLALPTFAVATAAVAGSWHGGSTPWFSTSSGVWPRDTIHAYTLTTMYTCSSSISFCTAFFAKGTDYAGMPGSEATVRASAAAFTELVAVAGGAAILAAVFVVALCVSCHRGKQPCCGERPDPTLAAIVMSSAACAAYAGAAYAARRDTTAFRDALVAWRGAPRVETTFSTAQAAWVLAGACGALHGAASLALVGARCCVRDVARAARSGAAHPPPRRAAEWRLPREAIQSGDGGNDGGGDGGRWPWGATRAEPASQATVGRHWPSAPALPTAAAPWMTAAPAAPPLASDGASARATAPPAYVPPAMPADSYPRPVVHWAPVEGGDGAGGAGDADDPTDPLVPPPAAPASLAPLRASTSRMVHY